MHSHETASQVHGMHLNSVKRNTSDAHLTRFFTAGFASRDLLAQCCNNMHHPNKHGQVDSNNSKQRTNERPDCAMLGGQPAVLVSAIILPSHSSRNPNNDGWNLQIQSIQSKQTNPVARKAAARPGDLMREDVDEGFIQQNTLAEHPLNSDNNPHHPSVHTIKAQRSV